MDTWITNSIKWSMAFTIAALAGEAFGFSQVVDHCSFWGYFVIKFTELLLVCRIVGLVFSD